MRKLLYFASILLICLILFNPKSSNATTTAIVYLQANKDIIETGEEIEISFHIKDKKTAAFYTTIYFDETKLEIINPPENSNVNKNQLKILWYDTKGGNGAKEDELGKVVFKAKAKGLANFIIDGEFYTEKGQLIQTNFKPLQVQIGKEETSLEKQAKEEQGTNTQTNNADLESLRLEVEGIVPNFEPNIYKYDLTVGNNINDIEVLAIAQNPNTQIEITGNTRIKTRNKHNKYKNNIRR